MKITDTLRRCARFSFVVGKINFVDTSPKTDVTPIGIYISIFIVSLESINAP